MNRTTSIIYYIVVSFLSVIALITFIRVPAIIFVGIEDQALSVLFYILSVLGICTFSLSIIDFFLIKLGIYGIMHIENNDLKYRVEQLEESNKNLKNELFEVKITIKYMEKRD